jgi:hypothetical protein
LFGRRVAGTIPADLADLVAGIEKLEGVQREFVINAGKEALSAILKLSSQHKEKAGDGRVDTDQVKLSKTG